MNPATKPGEGGKLLVMRARGTVEDCIISELPSLLGPGDLLVVNDAATLPASLRGRTEAGEDLELRLAQQESEDGFVILTFSGGSWREPTEKRRSPSTLAVGSVIRLGTRLTAWVEHLLEPNGRIARIRFNLAGPALLEEIYRIGEPVRYSYLLHEEALWSYQTPFASRPWSFEMPSAGKPLRWKILLQLLSRGIEIASLTHAAGLSSTGREALDALFPLRERFRIPEETVQALHRARRVIAVGTSVARALEGAYLNGDGKILAGPGDTDLRLGPGFARQVVDGLLSGIHEPGESHFDLFEAFAPRELLDRGLELARDRGYLSHEFGDSCLILAA